MKPDRLTRLFTAAARAPTPRPEPDFAAGVLRAIRRETPVTRSTLADQIGALLPRVAFAAALLMAAGCTTDLALDSLGSLSLSDGLSQLSEQWLFAAP